MAHRGAAPGGAAPALQGPAIAPPAMGAPVDPSTAGAAQLLPGAPQSGTPDASLVGAQNLLTQYAPQSSPGMAAPGQIAPDPYLAQANEHNEEQLRFEQEHGKLATIGTQAARGVLDFVMAPAALLGAAAEGAGTATGWDGLRDFGRQYGESTSGSAAMATLFNRSGWEALKSSVNAESDPSAALSAYDRTRQDIHEQQEAWPMLSTVSHLTGLTAAALATAGLAAAPELATGAAPVTAGAAPVTAGARVLGAAGTGAYEGSAAGAQTAYMENRPYRDVLGSTIMGGLMGAATAAGFQGVAEGFGSHAFSEGLESFAKGRTFKALGGGKREATVLGREGIDRIAEDVGSYVSADGSTIFPQSMLKAGTLSQSEIAEKVAAGAAETGEKLGEMRRSVSEYIDASAPHLRPKVSDLLDQINPVAKDLADDPLLAGRATEINKVVESLQKKAGEDGSISVNDLRSVQESLKKRLYTKVIADVPAAKKELQGVERMIEDTIEKTVDKAVPEMGTAEAGAYRDLRRVTQSFIQAKDMTENQVARQIGNRSSSLSDTLAGTAAFAGDIATGGPIMAGLKGIGAAALHKYGREHGSAFMAALANKMANNSHAVGHFLSHGAHTLGEANLAGEAEGMEADARSAAELATGTLGGNLFGRMFDNSRDAEHVSVDSAGGREAQQVIAHLNRARLEVQEHVEAAGPNPVQRQAAQQYAMAQIATNLAAKSGAFDPANWAQKPPNPLQKVLHRGPLLDQVSQDLAKDTAHAASLKPSPDFDLNPDRVQRLTKGANGPLAIGGVQQAVRDIVRESPPTPTGDQVRMVARLALQRLSASDVPDAMTTGHQLARVLSGMSEGAADQLTKDYIARNTTALSSQLSAPAFGKAGQLYGKLTNAADPGYQQLLDPAQVRASLANADSTGILPGALKQLAASVLDAHDAKKQLGGEGADKSVTKTLKAIEERFADAEKAVTLDGGPAGRVLDFFSGKPGADAAGLRGDPQLTVLNAVRPQMERLLPVLGKQSDRYTGAASKPSVQDLPKSSGELQSLYSERMQTLAANVTSPDNDAVANSLKGLPNVPPAIQAAVAGDAQQRMAQLLQDTPKPTSNIRGKAYETLSSDDLRKANAMWEATTKPMSVFADFHSGSVDYDKVQYTWKQYPGLQQAAQAGMMDAIHSHLSDDERANIPDPVLTQLDYLLGFNGTLQTSVDRGFASRMTALAQAEDQNKPKQNGPLDLESSKPTFTERIAQGRG